MDKEDIQAFQAVARYKSYTKASSALSIGQPTLSKKIAKLEKEVGVTLLARTKRSVKLTYAGLVFQQGSQSLLEQEMALLEAVRMASNSAPPGLQLAIMGTGLSQQFLPILRRFKRDHSDISLELSLMDFPQLQQSLETETVDCAIAGDLGLSFLAPLKTVVLCPAYNCLVLPQDHPWLKETRRDGKRLSHEPFIVFSDTASAKSYEKVKEICSAWGFTPRISRQCSTVEEILFHVQAGLGLAILPDFDLPPEGKLPLAYVPIKKTAAPFATVLAWNARHNNPAVSLFKDYLLEHSKNS